MKPANRTDHLDNERIGKSVGLLKTGYDRSNLVISTDRYTSRDYAERERQLVWMKVWQVVGRIDELADTGDWKEYRLYDQSFIVIKGSDDVIRGFVNACPHRGNALCQGKKGQAKARLTCPYHKWSFALDGRLVGVGRPDLVGELDKSAHGLVRVSVETFAGFIFLNPDPDAEPLSGYLGEDVMRFIDAYHIEKMTPVMDVREALECNWKVVNDAFQEGYHIDGIHPELLKVIVIDPTRTQYYFTRLHNLANDFTTYIAKRSQIMANVMQEVGAVISNYRGLSRKVLEYSQMMKRLVDSAKAPGFSRDSWAPLKETIDSDEFVRVGNFKEVMDWEGYISFLTDWAMASDWECSFKRITETGNTVFLELEERSRIGEFHSVVNSVSVYEFNAAGKITHMDIYLQMELPSSGMLSSYQDVKIAG